MAYFDRTTETLDREKLEAMQLQKLQSMLARIYGPNRLFTAKFQSCGVKPDDIRSLTDLSRLPLTTKSELLHAQTERSPFGSNATFPESAYTRVHQTSGTTGTPLRVIDTPDSWELWGRCWGHVFAGAGLAAGDRIFVAFAFGPFIGFWAAVEGIRQIGAMMIPGGGFDSLQRLRMMRDLGATALCCTPTYALRLAEVAREHQFDLRQIPVRATIHAGEPGANIEHTKQRIESSWGAKCYDHAGASEVGAHSYECEVQPRGIHVIESEFIVEVLDSATGRAAPAGEIGELVITNLGRIGFPVIRYRTGDLVRLNQSACACGRTFARFDGGILGRADDMVVVRGVNVFPAALENMIRQFPMVEEFRVTVNTSAELRELAIEIEINDESGAETVRADVERAVQQGLSLRPRVAVVTSGSLPRFELKARRFRVFPG